MCFFARHFFHSSLRSVLPFLNWASLVPSSGGRSSLLDREVAVTPIALVRYFRTVTSDWRPNMGLLSLSTVPLAPPRPPPPSLFFVFYLSDDTIFFFPPQVLSLSLSMLVRRYSFTFFPFLPPPLTLRKSFAFFFFLLGYLPFLCCVVGGESVP